MGRATAIAWADSTFNPWIGCTKVGPGCDGCYAEANNQRYHRGVNWGPGAPRRQTKPDYWKQPITWNKKAAAGKFEHDRGDGAWRVFCASQADVFDNAVDQDWRLQLWRLIERTPHLTWQLVTKRVGNVSKMVPPAWMVDGYWPSNVWLIATMVNQVEFDRDWPKLANVPARIRGLSIEPMLGPIRFPESVRGLLHWAIYGGESAQPGHPARECNIGWILDGLQQCHELGIAPFVKQLGHNALETNGTPYPYGTGKRADPAEWAEPLRVQEFPA